MRESKEYATKTIFQKRDNVKVPGYFPIAIDIGYSSVNVFAPTCVCSFPSFAVKLGKNANLVGTPSEHEILYRDEETGDIWRVGAEAQNSISSLDTNFSVSELYGRNRYFTPIYQVLIRTAIGLALIDAGGTSDTIAIMTGLPPAYLDEDSEAVKEAFTGEHTFSLKVGNNPYKKITPVIKKSNVSVMSQPKGTLISVSINDDGELTRDGSSIITDNAVVFDGGFGTLDLFAVNNRQVTKAETFSDLGMNAVLSRLCELVREKYGATVRVPAIQPNLRRGKVTVTKKLPDKHRFSSTEVPIDDLLEQASREVCDAAIDKMLNIYDNLVGVRNLIVTGGTGAAWKEYILDAFKEYPMINVIMGNANDPDLDIIFANVRGYYMTLVRSLQKRAKTA